MTTSPEVSRFTLCETQHILDRIPLDALGTMYARANRLREKELSEQILFAMNPRFDYQRSEDAIAELERFCSERSERL